jgi:hypothetical protein
MLEAMARINPSQPNDAIARIASRRNRTISLDSNLLGQNSERGSLDVDSKLFSKVQIDSKEDWARIRGKLRPPPPCSHQSPQFYVQPSSNFADPPCSAASFEVNSEPHIGARPSVRLCVGLINAFPQNGLFGLSWKASVDSASVYGDTGEDSSTRRVERTKFGPLTPRETSRFGKIPEM